MRIGSVMEMDGKSKAEATTSRTALLTTALLLLLLSASAASAATITVDDSGGADYTTIQAAVDNASGGDVSGDGVVDAWDCTYLARAIAGVPGYSL